MIFPINPFFGPYRGGIFFTAYRIKDETCPAAIRRPILCPEAATFLATVKARLTEWLG